MERSQVLDAMGQLKLYGMRTAYDEIIATAVKRQHEPQQIIGDLLAAEISEKQARSIKYQMTIAKLPLAKEIKEFDFEAAEVNETLIHDLATGDFLDHQRNLVLIGGTGTGKTHLAVSIARACIRNGRRGRFFNVVDLVNKLDAEARAERQGRTADLISRLGCCCRARRCPNWASSSGATIRISPRATSASMRSSTCSSTASPSASAPASGASR
jgi:DNA replication protein DnaC